MEKRDLARERKDLYQPPRDPVLVDVPDLLVVAIDGKGDPNTSAAYAAAVEALYAVSYGVKFWVKRGEAAVDFKVMPLEGLWWAEDMSAFVTEHREDWQWTMLIVQPPPVTPDLVERIVAETARKKNLPALPRMRCEVVSEGAAAQVMHVGPYAAEGPTIANLHAFIADQGLVRRGKHHEIYLGDPRRAAPARLKTVIRQPVAQV